MSVQQVAKAILQRDNFIISSHINLEGDAVGSQLAFYMLLKKLGKKAVLSNAEPIPEELCFLPCASDTFYKKEGFEEAKTAVVLDCAGIERTGDISSNIAEVGFIINIDHHISNSGFGDVNWVKSDSSSVGEMLYYLCKELDIVISREIAECLYVSIVTDTGNFSYSNTSAETHKIVSELIKAGVSSESINNNLKANIKKSDIDALVNVLGTLRVIGDGRIAYLVLSNEMIKETGTDLVNSNYYIDYARFIKGVEVAIFFRENLSGEVKVSFRSKNSVDVNEIAGIFGGGGHKAASGCKVMGNMDEVIKQVVSAVEGVLKQL